MLEPKFEGHFLMGRLTKKGKKVVVGMTKSLVQPKNILMNLKSKRKDNLTNIKQVCNKT